MANKVRMKKYAIYPSYWAEKWGEPPMLGTVLANNEFEAVRNAYNIGLVRYNFTFEPKPVEMPYSGFRRNKPQQATAKN